jgi:hypothetical protein
MKKARNSFFYIGGGISLVMTLLILMGYIWTPYSPTQMDASAQSRRPPAASAGHRQTLAGISSAGCSRGRARPF